MLLDFYGGLLKSEGFEVDVAADGEEALRLMQHGGYDLILLDVHLPKLEGPQVLEALAKNPPKIANKKVIMLTNVTHETLIVEKVKEFGVTQFLLKSDFTPDQFLDQVKKALSS